LRFLSQAVRAFGYVADGETAAGLYSASADGHVRVWHPAAAGTPGECSAAVPMEADVGSLLLVSGWLFVGTAAGLVRCWNMGSNARHELAGHSGQVQALAAALDRSLLFSGGQDMTVRAWQYNAASGQFEAAGVLAGHTRMVSCLLAVGKWLFSGSLDGTVRAWDLDTAACAYAVEAHDGGCMALLLWQGCLLSGGLDGKLRVWSCNDPAAAPPGTPVLQCVATFPDCAEEAQAGSAGGGAFMPPSQQPRRRPAAEPLRVLAFCGTLHQVSAAEAEAMLVVAYDDRSVRFYALPTFEARGRLNLRVPLRALAPLAAGAFAGGDEGGLVKVWRFAQPGEASPQQGQGGGQQGAFHGGGGGRRRS
jgi:WD40 repeat protein